MIPLPYKILAFVGLLLSAVVFGWWKGKSETTAEYELKIQQARAEIAELQVKAANQSVKIVTEYVDRVKVVKEKGETIIKEVPIYVPVNSPDLPPGFRVLHDAAARGETPNPSGITDASPVPAQDVATTIADNYTGCTANIEQVVSLQTWIREVCK